MAILASASASSSTAAAAVPLSNPLLSQLSSLLLQHAEIFADPSASPALSDQIHQLSLTATKHLFDTCTSLRDTGMAQILAELP